MQRVQQRRQRENRQEAERLKSLIAAYRSLAGSFSPAAAEHRMQMEEALADVVLFGSLQQVALAARYAQALTLGQTVDYQPLIDSMRADLRAQLGLQQIPLSIELPPAGPGRTMRTGRNGGEGTGRAGGGGGGGIGGAAGMSGIGAGMIAADAMEPPPS
jgi:hypothetical protein